MSRTKSPPGRASRKDELVPSSNWGSSLDAVAMVACASLWIATIATTNDSTTVPGLFDWLGVFWALLATAILVLAGWKRIDIARHWSLADTALLVWLVWQCVSVAAVIGHGNLRLAVNGLLQTVTMAVIYWCVRGTARRPIDQKWFLAIALSAVAGLAATGVYQRHVLQPREVAAYDRNPEAYLDQLAAEYPAGSKQRIQLENRLRSTEPTSVFALTNSFAGLLATWLMVLIATRTRWLSNVSPSNARQATSQEHARDWPRIVYRYIGPIAIGILIGYTLLLTKSRTALLALLIGVALFGFSQLGKWGLRTAITLSALAIGGIVLGFSLLAFGVWDIEVFSESPKSVLYRLEYWYSSLRMLADHPWFGVGPGNFQSAYTQYKLPQASETVADPHNFLLEALATTGLPGGIAAVAVLVFAIAHCLRSPASSREEGASPPKPGDTTFDLWGSLLTLAVGFVLAGGIGIISQMTGSNNSKALVVVGLPTACVAFVILSPRLAAATDLKTPVLAGVVVLLVNLLAAGGWTFPSVASSMWLLLAVGANWSAAGQATPSDATSSHSSLPLATAAAMLVAGVWAVAATRLELVPLASSQVQIANAQDLLLRGDFAGAERAANEAEKLDAWSDVPPSTLAQIHWRKFLRGHLAADLERFEAALLRLQTRSPRSASLRAQMGDLFAAAYRETGDSHWLEQATHSYREALARYPASGIYAVQLALAEWLSGNRATAVELADRALELDRQNPHIEQKLKSQKIAWLVPASTKTPPHDLAGLLEKHQDSAEQVAIYLRSTAATDTP